MIDFHTHILPDIDDGSSSVEESVRMIEMLLEQGVKKIFLTPHFYAYLSSADRFDEKRVHALKMLTQALTEKSVDAELYLGGEVLYFDDLWRVDRLDRFCIKGTNIILLEMPFSKWENSFVEGVCKLINKGYIPVIAHFERYLHYKGNKEKLRSLVLSGALLQMNCGYINNWATRRKALKLIRKGVVFALGSDCHNISERKPDVGTSYEVLKKKLKKHHYDSFIRRQTEFLRKATIVYSL